MDSDLSSLISAVEQGDSSAAEPLFAALYAELHRMARRELARHGAPVGLGVTTLLHEAYVDVAQRQSGLAFPDRARFMSYASRVMRGLIIDHARNRCAQKHGGRFHITALTTNSPESIIDDRELSQISDALDELARSEPELAQLVDLKFFCGFTFAEIADMRGTSERTVQRNWEKARLYLHNSIRADLSP